MRTARGKLLFDVTHLNHGIYDDDEDVDFGVWVYPNGDISYSIRTMEYVPKSYLLWL